MKKNRALNRAIVAAFSTADVVLVAKGPLLEYLMEDGEIRCDELGFGIDYYGTTAQARQLMQGLYVVTARGTSHAPPPDGFDWEFTNVEERRLTEEEVRLLASENPEKIYALWADIATLEEDQEAEAEKRLEKERPPTLLSRRP